MSRTNALSLIPGYYGGENFYKNPLFPNFVYTEGIREIAEKSNSFWLIVDIFCFQLSTELKNQSFQVWKLERVFQEDKPTTSFMLFCEDGNEKTLLVRKYDISNFQFDMYHIWFVDNTLLLPVEY
ncbi:hypothetical protein Q361_11730 [Flavobacterium croceum DSM 17960]|uniref:DUF6876 domain-containing protein n=1 Tax=Flavobacterium croceum DSM 17960 TaxID=1121886 RepID=A0A2S4N5H8_9FLAO|nr:DUF6876 family protein [Flavobacterium croceum]POS00926.1 hypothetical protein Q361_11730 [Flavobacterium croceum DSM 17960]